MMPRVVAVDDREEDGLWGTFEGGAEARITTKLSVLRAGLAVVTGITPEDWPGRAQLGATWQDPDDLDAPGIRFDTATDDPVLVELAWQYMERQFSDDENAIGAPYVIPTPDEARALLEARRKRPYSQQLQP